MYKKILSAAIALIALFHFSACGLQDNGEVVEKVDVNRTQLFVQNFNGGYGNDWINQIKKSFETEYASVSFEKGKTGVQIMVNNQKKTGTSLASTLLDESDKVFCIEDVPYEEYVALGLLLDISDVIDGSFDINVAMGDDSVPDVQEKDILGKLNSIQLKTLKYSGNKYYAIPHYEGYYGFTYDADLFNKKHYFMAEDGSFSKRNTDSGLSKGPDGIAGTYDDGLPATYADFYRLCDQMVMDRVIPIAWSGQYQFYISNAINQLAADYNGYANESLNYSFNGTSTEYVSSFNLAGEPVITSKEITTATGYEVFKQAGLYYALTLLEKMVETEGYLYDNSLIQSFTHTDAQNEYLNSNYLPGKMPIAMLAEGIWWQNEADGHFQAMETSFSAGKYDRNLKFMPLPKATADKVGKTTLLESQNSFMFIASDIDEKYIPLAKLFLQYCNTTERLQEFTVLTNTPKALKYEITPAQEDALSPFGKSLMQMKNAKVADEPYTQVVYQLSSNRLYANNKSKFRRFETLAFGDNSFPSTAMSNVTGSGISAKNYFLGVYNSWKTKWSLFSEYFD